MLTDAKVCRALFKWWLVGEGVWVRCTVLCCTKLQSDTLWLTFPCNRLGVRYSTHLICKEMTLHHNERARWHNQWAEQRSTTSDQELHVILRCNLTPIYPGVKLFFSQAHCNHNSFFFIMAWLGILISSTSVEGTKIATVPSPSLCFFSLVVVRSNLVTEIMWSN